MSYHLLFFFSSGSVLHKFYLSWQGAYYSWACLVFLPWNYFLECRRQVCQQMGRAEIPLKLMHVLICEVMSEDTSFLLVFNFFGNCFSMVYLVISSACHQCCFLHIVTRCISISCLCFLPLMCCSVGEERMLVMDLWR